jgi:hypothetical protein
VGNLASFVTREHASQGHRWLRSTSPAAVASFASPASAVAVGSFRSGRGGRGGFVRHCDGPQPPNWLHSVRTPHLAFGRGPPRKSMQQRRIHRELASFVARRTLASWPAVGSFRRSGQPPNWLRLPRVPFQRRWVWSLQSRMRGFVVAPAACAGSFAAGTFTDVVRLLVKELRQGVLALPARSTGAAVVLMGDHSNDP